ncbi:GNAT family N-acetyltransferase [Gracilibacillus thailandensis]|uniref:GNAT family N-acetyltransferase n=2 Tax=Gracilibacillus thailandensis TaxID=563735 RepID=A0A6N7R389_9BACI|nr:GNAT family N-acetyltransferase [Gracilibacillus thailandensis]
MKMNQISKLDETYYGDIMDLSQYAFQYRLSEEELAAKKEQMSNHTVWGWLENEQLAAKVHVIPLKAYIQGEIMKMGGVASVASWPEYRRGGKVKQLLKKALQEMKTKGQIISYLHPFSVPFYRKYGWEITFDKADCKIPIRSLKKRWDGIGFVKRGNNNDQTISMLDNIYTEYASSFTGPLVRDQHWWKHRILNKDDFIAIAYHDDHTPEGYIVYNVKDHIFTVKDIAFSTLNGQKLLLQYMHDHDSMADDIVVSLPINDGMTLLVEEPRFEQKVTPYFMSRIVDAGAFLAQFPYKKSDHFSTFAIHIEDQFLPENTGVYQLSMNDHDEMKFDQVDKRDSLPTVTMNIQQMAQIFLGYKRPHELSRLELLDGDQKAIGQLEEIIPTSHTYFPDFF